MDVTKLNLAHSMQFINTLVNSLCHCNNCPYLNVTLTIFPYLKLILIIFTSKLVGSNKTNPKSFWKRKDYLNTTLRIGPS